MGKYSKESEEDLKKIESLPEEIRSLLYERYPNPKDRGPEFCEVHGAQKYHPVLHEYGWKDPVLGCKKLTWYWRCNECCDEGDLSLRNWQRNLKG